VTALAKKLRLSLQGVALSIECAKVDWYLLEREIESIRMIAPDGVKWTSVDAGPTGFALLREPGAA
jgi:hypothetical protein